MAEEITHNSSSSLAANRAVAANLNEMADLLEQQGADGFRVSAYRHASDTVSGLDQSLESIFARTGVKGLVALPAIGRSIAAAITEMIHTGRWAQLERLRGTTSPEKLFRTVPGIGPQLAARLHDQLHIDTLEALELAACDGRLKQVAGFGERRINMIKAILKERLDRRRLRNPQTGTLPSVEHILSVDQEYRQRAASGQLRKIAPRRFNPDSRAWLPVLHTRRENWIFTAMFSNTRRAHQLQKTNDWVIVFYHSDETAENQSTVVTETIGPWAGYRVVRGREKECADYYYRRNAAA